ncbi:MAG: hypothetical protein KatS3mg060_2342 [Dehalococcoidia bacterium]|nr:MAG: hypothetical protein KatS3mg060_2342 [Dehalococcoidia bacterium]
MTTRMEGARLGHVLPYSARVPGGVGPGSGERRLLC